jgi:hypothetical protein
MSKADFNLIGKPLQVRNLPDEPVSRDPEIGRRLGQASIGLIAERRKERRHLIAIAQGLDVFSTDVLIQHPTHSRCKPAPYHKRA